MPFPKKKYDTQDRESIQKELQEIERRLLELKLSEAEIDYNSIESVIEEEKYVQAYQSSYNFLAHSWSIFEGRDFVGNKGGQAIGEHLDACLAGQIKRLIINVAPRCLVKGSEVLMSDNSYKKIEEVEIGDSVYSYNNKIVHEKVTDVISSGTKFCLELKFNGGNILRCSINHRIYTPHGWIEAKDLKIHNIVLSCKDKEYADEILNRDITYLEIQEIKEIGKHDCFDLTINNTECFFCDEILVHNSGKSALVNKAFPAFAWIKKPELRIANCSYSGDLAYDGTIDSKKIITSDWYRKGLNTVWKDLNGSDTVWDISKTNRDLNKDYYNTANGRRFCTSVGGTFTGKGADFILIDDPLSPEEAESKIERENCIRWARKTLSSRLDDKVNGVMILIMQRLNLCDLAQYYIDNEDWELLKIPTEWDESKRFWTSLGWTDWRKVNGESADPVRFPYEFIEEEKKKPDVWSSQYQQEPVPEGGGKIKSSWWNTYWVLPTYFDSICMAFDLNTKKGDNNDNTALVVVGRKDDSFYVIDLVYANMDITDQLAAIVALDDKYPYIHKKLIEDKSNGSAVWTLLNKTVRGLEPVDPKGIDKELRITASLVPKLIKQSIYLPPVDTHPWVKYILEESKFFPRGKHDDACLHPDTLIPVLKQSEDFKNYKLEKIVNIEIGDKVFTHNGNWKNVTNLMNRDFDGEILNVKTCGAKSILITDNHNVPCYLRQNRNGKRLINRLPMGKLNKRDMLFEVKHNIEQQIEDIDMLNFQEFPLIKDRKINRHNELIVTEEYIKFTNCKSNLINRYIKVDKELCRLIGYYIAEGSCGRHNVEWTFNSNEIDYQLDVERLIEHCFGLKTARTKVRKNCGRVGISNYFLRAFFDQFGDRAINKFLPMWLFNLPKELLAELVKGYWYGDGCRTKKNNYVLTTSSSNLYSAFKNILYKFGITSTIKNGVYKVIADNPMSYCHPLFNMCFAGSNANLFAQLVGDFYTETQTIIESKVINKEEKIIKSIWNINKVQYTGKVYNLEVEDDHSYHTESFCVMNCDALSYAVNYLDNNTHIVRMPIEVYTETKENYISRADARAVFDDYSSYDIPIARSNKYIKGLFN